MTSAECAEECASNVLKKKHLHFLEQFLLLSVVTQN